MKQNVQRKTSIIFPSVVSAAALILFSAIETTGFVAPSIAWLAPSTAWQGRRGFTLSSTIESRETVESFTVEPLRVEHKARRRVAGAQRASMAGAVSWSKTVESSTVETSTVEPPSAEPSTVEPLSVEQKAKGSGGTITWSKTAEAQRHKYAYLPASMQKPRTKAKSGSESVTWSLGRMGQAPLLTAKQELTLGARCQRLSRQEEVKVDLRRSLGRGPTVLEWASASNFTRLYTKAFQAEALRAGVPPPPGVPQDDEVARAFRNELSANRAAKEQLVNANMRLVVSIARRYQKLGVSLQDLVQEGSLGLIRAAEKYDPSRGFRFSTYASWWVQQSVFRAVAFQSRIIRLPMHVHNLLNRVRAAKKELWHEMGASPSDEDVAERVGIPVTKLKSMLQANRPTFSSSHNARLRASRGSSSGGTFEAVTSIEDSLAKGKTLENHQNPVEYVDGALFRSEMTSLLSALDEDERFVVTLRYGLGVPRRLTMNQIAELAGTERVWVKKMEQRALRKMRRPHHMMNLRPFSVDKKALDEAMCDQDRMMHYRPTWQDGTEMTDEELPDWEQLRETSLGEMEVKEDTAGV
mmetsp:Transcript_16008/g.29595  ORF Transcript_16008/g.29595 Transcript_16008/m.29595 type:complete len:581 (-) Transcript_16008:174-1916(-)|eukprot:CAMPEP_0171636670 /NCGR_PEP_ID=MMETSP0990-20121206/27577_1 /TAXON_ID=483369 /ORGANISM="non described non described, Strain CCMP2098" /LENGTH=580 /DNA_ID=CAMNT_0012208903 /DNA_START=49 /DNA_END=1791 /DNA_ORIENTATION=-